MLVFATRARSGRGDVPDGISDKHNWLNLICNCYRPPARAARLPESGVSETQEAQRNGRQRMKGKETRVTDKAYEGL